MSDSGATLVRMANQIARNYSYLAGDEQAKAVAAHLKRFWTPDMRNEFLAGAAAADLDDAVAAALPLLAA